MDQYKKIMHGSTSAVYINGERDVLATSFPEYNGYSIEGTITDRKSDSWLELAIADGYRTGIMPDIVIMTSLGRRGSAARERWSLSGVVFTEVALANIEAKKGVERELPFKAVYAKNLEAIQ